MKKLSNLDPKMRRIQPLKRRRALSRSLATGNNQGLTLIECLVAIAVIALSASLITPAVLLSVATRVQSQQAEQAFQVAQSEVDRIKLVVERGGDYTLNIALAPTAVNSLDDFDGLVNPPEDVDINYSTIFSSAKAVDIDRDGENDFAVQIFRTESNNTGTDPTAFDLGVRVYRNDVVENKPASALEPDQASLNFTRGEGESGSHPLAVIYTSIIKSDLEGSLCDYHNFIDSVNGTTTSTPFGC